MYQYYYFELVVNSMPLFFLLFLAPCYLFCNGLMDHLCLCANLGSPFRPFPHIPHPPFNSTLVCLFILQRESLLSLSIVLLQPSLIQTFCPMCLQCSYQEMRFSQKLKLKPIFKPFKCIIDVAQGKNRYHEQNGLHLRKQQAIFSIYNQLLHSVFSAGK